MAITTPKAVKEALEGIEGIEGIIESRVKIVYRDVALTWPSTDKLAENPVMFEDHLTNLLNDGWQVEETQIGTRRAIGDMANEFVVPIIFILTR